LCHNFNGPHSLGVVVELLQSRAWRHRRCHVLLRVCGHHAGPVSAGQDRGARHDAAHWCAMNGRWAVMSIAHVCSGMRRRQQVVGCAKFGCGRRHMHVMDRITPDEVRCSTCERPVWQGRMIYLCPQRPWQLLCRSRHHTGTCHDRCVCWAFPHLVLDSATSHGFVSQQPGTREVYDKNA